MSRSLKTVAQDFSNAMAEAEYWRINDTYPHDNKRKAWVKRSTLLSELILVSAKIKPTWVAPTKDIAHD